MNTYELSIVSANNSQIFFTYRTTYPYKLHFVTANYGQLGDSSYFLNEQIHKTYQGDDRFAVCSKSSRNGFVVWHAANINFYVVYFSLGLTNFSIRRKHVSSQAVQSRDGIDMDIAHGYVWILTNHENGFLIIINESDHYVRGVYDVTTPSYSYNLFVKDRSINIIGCNLVNGTS